MMAHWRKRLGKVADVMFTVPVVSLLWGDDMYEPVVIALICSLFAHSPWQVWGTALMDEL